MLHLLSWKIIMSASVTIYTSETCPYCVRAKELLKRKNVEFTEIRVDLLPEKRDEMIQLTGRRTVPQIFINNQPIGGCDDLYELDRAGKLDKLLAGE